MYQHTDTGEIIADSSPVTGPDGTNYPGDWDKSALSWLRRVTETAAPTGDPAVIVTGWHVDDSGVQVWDTRAETADERKQRVNAPILAQLAEIDTKTVRPLRAILAVQAAGLTPSEADIQRVAEYDAAASALRSQLLN